LGRLGNFTQGGRGQKNSLKGKGKKNRGEKKKRKAAKTTTHNGTNLNEKNRLRQVEKKIRSSGTQREEKNSA